LCKALISVSASQSPLITIASRGSPNRSEIRFSPSPNPTKSTLREIRISRPDSPSISINNRQGIPNQPKPYTNGNDNAFHISLGTPINVNQRELSISSPPPPPPSSSSIHMLGRVSPVKLNHINIKNKGFVFRHFVRLKCIVILQLIIDIHQM